MNNNGNTNGGTNNDTNAKKMKFNLHKSVQVTKLFFRENQAFLKNATVFTMVDTHNPGRTNQEGFFLCFEYSKLFRWT